MTPSLCVRSSARVTDDRAIDLLRRMVEIPSLSRQEGAVAEFLVAQMGGLGLDAHIDGAGNAVGATVASQGARDIVLLGHMDTVPGEIPVRIEDGVLHGRGSVDAKGPLAAFVVAAACATLPPDVRLVVVGAVEEEVATSRGARFAARCFEPAACVIGEPSSWDAVTIGYKGRLLAEYSLRLPCGHTAGPNSGVAEHAVAWWHSVRGAVDALNAGRSTAFESVQAGLRSINTDSDGLYDTVRAVAGFRLPPGTAPQAIESVCVESCHRVGRLCGLLGAGEPLAPDPSVAPDHRTATVAFAGHETAVVADRQSALVRAFTGSIRAAGSKPRLLLKTGTSDMNVVAPIWGCPIAAYGPGDSALDHTPNEHIRLDEYLRSIAVLRSTLERLGAELSQGNTP